ncbi:YadA-like family protein [Spartinivicinus ruber]|uniref:YadA-like family protein n=1 Tax=Spartinivicinus ruber TaxID=2683272 RepID=UPI0013D15EF1|nr:YadA C-terminal domain-containing protein [Spartinivicinus ruber]
MKLKNCLSVLSLSLVFSVASNYALAADPLWNKKEIDQNRQRIEKNENNIQMAKSTNAKQTKRLNQHDNDIQANKKLAGEAKQWAMNAENKAINNEKKINKNTETLENHETRITTNTKHIGQNSQRLDRHDGQISDNTTRSLNNSARIDSLQTQIDDLEDDAFSGIATSMAIAGMPQAVDGKNLISVGAGYYKGKQGIAVGISANRGKHTTKFSLGTGGGSVSGSVGYGYSF